MKNTIDRSIRELAELDDLSSLHSPIHAVHPGAKLLVTVFFMVTVISFHKYDLAGLWIMILYPILLSQISGISLGLALYRLRLVLPVVCVVGLFNPLFDRAPALRLGAMTVTFGMISMVTLILKGFLCLLSSFLLIATTRIEEICGVLRSIHVPKLLVTLILLTYRYISVMAGEVSVMTQAYSLRAPRHKGIHYTAWGSFLGQLLLRSMDKAEELYSAMLLRGYQGEFYYATSKRPRWTDAAYVIFWAVFFVLAGRYHLTRLLGQWITAF